MNIRPQEVTENGERSVRYKGSDGKMHDIAAGSSGAGEPAASPATAQSGYNLLSLYFIVLNQANYYAEPYKFVNGELTAVTRREFFDALVQDPAQPIIVKDNLYACNSPIARVTMIERNEKEPSYMSDFERVYLAATAPNYTCNITVDIANNQIRYSRS